MRLRNNLPREFLVESKTQVVASSLSQYGDTFCRNRHRPLPFICRC